MSLLETLLERSGRTRLPYHAKERYGFKGFVSKSNDFVRIAALPRRVWDADRDLLQNLVELLTEELKTPGGAMRLHPIQAYALHDIALFEGAFLPIGVGQGKSLISLLAPVVLDAERPVLFVPAALRDQTFDHVLPQMRKHWGLHPRLRVVGYSELSLAKNARMLEDLDPDLIVLDECHSVKAKTAGRTKRLVRWFREHPETRCVAMSGTVSHRSLKDFAHIAQWCLGDGTPLPAKWTELSDWADAIDEVKDDELRMAPGALQEFCADGENVRQGFRRRLVETPGVVASSEDQLGTSLRIEAFRGLKIPPKVWGMIEDMRETWTTPNGDIITEAVELWRHIRELALGFWYRWIPAPPKEWLDARREWKKYVRETLKHNRRNLDTELQVWNECSHDPDRSLEWLRWSAVKDSFRPNTVAEWVDYFALDAAIDWMERDGGIVWTEHRAFGELLGKRCRWTYHGAGDSRILTTDDPAIIASISAHGQGKNLQRYSRNLVVAPPTSGKVWEQLLGRTHRQGQEADEVVCEVFLHVDELRSSFDQARADARYLEDTFGNQQKLNYADIVV